MTMELFPTPDESFARLGKLTLKQPGESQTEELDPSEYYPPGYVPGTNPRPHDQRPDSQPSKQPDEQIESD